MTKRKPKPKTIVLPAVEVYGGAPPKAPPAATKVDGTFTIAYKCQVCGYSFSRRYPLGQLVPPVVECLGCAGMWAVRRSLLSDQPSWMATLTQGTSSLALPLEEKSWA